jgi:hypothetical protein
MLKKDPFIISGFRKKTGTTIDLDTTNFLQNNQNYNTKKIIQSIDQQQLSSLYFKTKKAR